MTAYRASARRGDSPAYSAWKVNTRRSRSSRRNRPTAFSQRPKPPSAVSRASCGVSRPSGESTFAAMKPAYSTSYSRVSQARSRAYPAASRGPANARTASVIASASVRTSSDVPSAKNVRYAGSSRMRGSRSSIEAPVAASVSRTMSGIVSTVGPVSSR